MSKVISNVLLGKDIPPDGKDRLYKVVFYNQLQMFLIGKSLEEAILNCKIGYKYRRVDDKYVEGVGYKVHKFYLVPTWRDLLSKQQVINNYTDRYRRQIIDLTDFWAFYDEYKKSYYITNKQTYQSITIK